MIARFEDYECDRRGDIGSFAREHSLYSGYRILIELAKAGKKKDGLWVVLLVCGCVCVCVCVFGCTWFYMQTKLNKPKKNKVILGCEQNIQ